MCLALQNAHCAFFLAKFIFFENHHNSYAICYKLVLIPQYAIKNKMTPWVVSYCPFLCYSCAFPAGQRYKLGLSSIASMISDKCYVILTSFMFLW